MCVIMYKPKGMKLPKRNVFEAMWNRNSDGAGFMWKDVSTNTIHYRKGYFDFETFYSDVKSVYKKNIEMAIHCRIATSGGINKGMCHPFPLVNNDISLKSSHGKSTTYPIMMHNGIIPTTYVRDLSDTCSYIINSLVPRYKTDKTFLANPFTKTKIENEISYSKLLFFSPNTDTVMIGNWTEVDGCYYSNTHWMPYSYNYNVSYKKKTVKKAMPKRDKNKVATTDCYDYSYRNSNTWNDYYTEYWNRLLED